jgi:hypothetical protein
MGTEALARLFYERSLGVDATVGSALVIRGSRQLPPTAATR